STSRGSPARTRARRRSRSGRRLDGSAARRPATATGERRRRCPGGWRIPTPWSAGTSRPACACTPHPSTRPRPTQRSSPSPGGLLALARRGPTLAPDFVVPDLAGRTVRLSGLRGKVVVLNLWATWCAPCIEEMPSMERLYGRLRDTDFALLAVSQDEDGKRVVAPFVERMHLTFPVLLDPERQ